MWSIFWENLLGSQALLLSLRLLSFSPYMAFKIYQPKRKVARSWLSKQLDIFLKLSYSPIYERA
jgi:hypothetical protein